MPTTFPLESLPVELQCSIIRYLDPIALISLSQTNKYFRKVIRPQQPHFAERLLALECLEEIGGPEIEFSRHGTLNPHRNSAEWEASRWACTSCLKLVPHYAFSNQSLSRLAFRKPIRGSLAAELCTSWEAGGRFVKQVSRYNAHAEEHKQLRRRYRSLASENGRAARRQYRGPESEEAHLWNRLTDYQDCGMEGFEGMTFEEFRSLSSSEEGQVFDTEAHAVAHVSAGSNRHARRCIECRFRRGGFKGSSGNHRGLGTASVPIVPGREVTYGTVVDRYFPGVCDILESKRPGYNAPVFGIYREGAVDQPWPLYRVRCPGCSQWKEVRAFRSGSIYPRWKPIDNTDTQTFIDQYYTWDGKDVTDAYLNELRCNHCFVKNKHGRETLGLTLVIWLEALIDAQMIEYLGTLMRGFYHLLPNMRYSPKSQKKALRAILADIKPLMSKSNVEFTRADIALIRQKRSEYLAMQLAPDEQGNTTDAGALFGSDPWLDQWVHDFDATEGMWFWLKGMKDEIQEDGIDEALVDWVLARDERVHS
ncbi:hypothetical protein BJX70DRAFT_357627 [Aspergillus crustosus]